MRIDLSIGSILLCVISLLANTGTGYPQVSPGDLGAGLDEHFFGGAMGFVQSLTDEEKSLFALKSPTLDESAGLARIRRAASNFFPSRQLTPEQEKGWEVCCRP